MQSPGVHPLGSEAGKLDHVVPDLGGAKPERIAQRYLRLENAKNLMLYDPVKRHEYEQNRRHDDPARMSYCWRILRGLKVAASRTAHCLVVEEFRPACAAAGIHFVLAVVVVIVMHSIFGRVRLLLQRTLGILA
jgi:hypothetical protein